MVRREAKCLDVGGIARWCPPQPVFDFGVGEDALHEEMEAAWRDDDDRRGAGGWVAGQFHPGGGYHQRIVEAGIKTRVLHLDGYGRNHREDGPAVVMAEAGPQGEPVVVHARWYRHDVLHRDDGPAQLVAGASPRYFHEGEQVFPQGSPPAAVHATFEAMVDEGETPSAAMGWLRVGAALDSLDGAVDLRRDGGDLDLAVGAIEAGVTDAATIAQVAHGRLPISWAAAGR